MCNGHSWCAGSIYTHYLGRMAKTMKKICFPVTFKFFILRTGDLLMTTGRSLHSTLIFIYHCNTTTLLHWTQIYLFHTYLSMISSSLRHHFYQIFDRHASLKPTWFNKVICQSPSFKNLISVKTSAPELCQAVMHLACCLTWNLFKLPLAYSLQGFSEVKAL